MIAKFAIGAEVWPGISKLVEEAGETQQVCGKLLGTDGQEEHWDGTNLRTRLEDELADLRAAIDFVVQTNGLDEARMRDRALAKITTFRVWHRDERTKPVAPTSPPGCTGRLAHDDFVFCPVHDTAAKR
jgi:hypothetical protein